MQSAVGQRAEALETAREAVTFRRELAGQNRAALLPNLASSLNNLANRQSAVGQRAEALASITEAVHHYRALAETNPDAFLPDLARSLSVQGDILAALGRPLEAHDAASEALVYLAPSFERYPDVFDDLAKLTLHAYLLRTQALGEEPEDSLLIPYRELLKTESTGSAATPPKKDHSQF
jgi:tetratricopeptide (TPR) repeat protein